MSNKVKELRSQLRIIVKDLLPEVINAEQHAELKKHIDDRINEIEKSVKKTMHEMNERQKNVMGMLVRNSVVK